MDKQKTLALVRRGVTAALTATMVVGSLPASAIAETLDSSTAEAAVQAGLGELPAGQAAGETQQDDAAAVAAELLPDPTPKPALEDGTYVVNVETRNAATPTQASMSNGALVRQARLRVEDGKATITLAFQGMDATGLGKPGEFVYLGGLAYYNSADGGETSTWGRVVDTQVDEAGNPITDGYSQYLEEIGQTAYPAHIEIPLDETAVDSANFYRLQAFVPVMAALMPGQTSFGYQNTLLNVDWSSLVNTTRLDESLAGAKALGQGNKSAEAWQALQDAIATADEALATASDQATVDAAADALDAAVQAFNDSADTPTNPETADTTGLVAAIKSAEAKLAKSDKVDSAKQALRDAIDAAQAVVDAAPTDQQEVDDALAALKQAVAEFDRAESAKPVVDKSALASQISAAKDALSKGASKGDDAKAALQAAIDAAQKVADNANASQNSVNSAVSSLKDAVAAFNASADKPADNDEKLDYKNLADGSYTVSVSMKKPTGESSMSDAAVSHDATLRVKDGAYYLTLSFKGLTFLGQQGYLGSLSYFKQGYTFANGQVSGEVEPATVLEYLKDASGSEVTDPLTGKHTPSKVEIQVVPQAIADADGYVPVQVFVPVMESLAAGSGTQTAMVDVDWSTLAKVGGDAKVDTSKLSAKLDEAKAVKQGDKTSSAWESLQAAIAKAQATLDSGTATQATVDAATSELDAAVAAFKASADKPHANKSVLDKAIEAAKAQTQGSKTDAAWSALQEAIEAAEKVSADDEATQDDVNKATTTLNKAVEAFKASADKDETTTESKLDKDNLENGTYYVSVSAYKATDHSTLSMSDKSFNHVVKLEVSDGTGAAGEVGGKSYKLTMDFDGMQISGKTGYLGGLSYYENGYTIGDTSVTGTTAPAEVLSVQTDASGNPVTDDYTSLLPASSNGQYPDQVRFPIYKQGVDQAEGFIPVQVFVPVMESIAAGTGTQTALLKVDWSTLSTDESKVGTDEETGTTSGGTQQSGGSFLNGSGTRPTMNLKKSTLTPTASTAKRATTRLPQTGDPVTVAGIVAAALAGFGSMAAGLSPRLRRRGEGSHDDTNGKE